MPPSLLTARTALAVLRATDGMPLADFVRGTFPRASASG
jgi:hypothetical protein